MKTQEYFGKFLWMFIPLVLVFIGEIIAEKMTENVVELLYEVEKNSVSGVTSIHLSIENDKNSVTIDKFSIKAPNKSVIVSSISTDQSKSPKSWSGELKRGKAIQALFVIEENLEVDSNFINSLIDARYQDRDEAGDPIMQTASLTEKGVVSFNKRLQSGFWLFLPLVLVGIFGFIYLEWLSGNETKKSLAVSSNEQKKAKIDR